MVFLCEIIAKSGCNTGITSYTTQGEGVTKYDEPQRHVEIGNWEITFSQTGTSTRASKLICKHKVKATEQMFFILEDGTLYLKEKQKTVAVSFAAGDLSASFLRKFNIHEVRRADPNRIVDLLAAKPDGSQCRFRRALTDGEVLSRKSTTRLKSVDGFKIQHASWVVVIYDNLNKTECQERRFNVLYSMQDHSTIMNVLDNYDKRRLSPLR